MFVSVTRLRLRSSRFLLPFLFYSLRSTRQARRSPGNVAVEAMRDSHGGYWTRSVWRDEASMRAFMTSGVHLRVMPKLLDWADEAAVVHWQQESAALPEWDDAHRRLVTQGRRSKVRYPSTAHETLHFPVPGQR
jgi:heme-degrading monooxygenase HmoA